MPYVQSVMIFLIVVFELTGYLEIGDLNPKKPYLYLMSAILISFFVGLWALFVFLDVTKKYELLHHFKYGQKAGLLKAIVILINVQVCTTLCLGSIFKFLISYNSKTRRELYLVYSSQMHFGFNKLWSNMPSF